MPLPGAAARVVSEDRDQISNYQRHDHRQKDAVSCGDEQLAYPAWKVAKLACCAASAMVNVSGDNGIGEKQSQEGPYPWGSGLEMHSRFAVRPVKTAERVGLHSAEPA